MEQQSCQQSAVLPNQLLGPGRSRHLSGGVSRNDAAIKGWSKMGVGGEFTLNLHSVIKYSVAPDEGSAI